MAKGWTEERRRKQAEMIRQWKPWEKSIDPRSKEGKEQSRMNALKHGRRSAVVGDMSREMKEALRCNRQFIMHLMSCLAAERQADY